MQKLEDLEVYKQAKAYRRQVTSNASPDRRVSQQK